MQIFRKPREIWPEQSRGQWVSGGYDHKRLEVSSAQGRCAIPPKFAVLAPTWVYITTKKRFFFAIFLCRENPVSSSGLRHRSVAFLFPNTGISLCRYPFCRGYSFTRKPIVTFSRNPIVSRPCSFVSRSFSEFASPSLPPSSVLK